MAIAERRDWRRASLLLRSSESPAESPYYITSNRRGIDLTRSPFPRVEHVAKHERACLDFLASSDEFNKIIRLLAGPNFTNLFTAQILFERLRRPDILGIDIDGRLIIFECKVDYGNTETNKERFANAARTKIELVPRFLRSIREDQTLLPDFLKENFPQDDIQEKIPERISVQDPSQMDFIFLTPNPEYKEVLLERVGKGEFRSIDHRTVALPTAIAA